MYLNSLSVLYMSRSQKVLLVEGEALLKSCSESNIWSLQDSLNQQFRIIINYGLPLPCFIPQAHQKLQSSLSVAVDSIMSIMTGSTNSTFRKTCLQMLQVGKDQRCLKVWGFNDILLPLLVIRAVLLETLFTLILL